MSKRRQSNPPKPSEPHQAPGPVTAEIQEARWFSGPLPSPSILEEYDRIVPGAAERILAMAEADARHQREIEFAALRAEVASQQRGQLYGLIIGVLTLLVVIVALFLGYPTVAGIIGGTTVVGLVSAFIIGRITKSSETGSSLPPATGEE